MKREGVLDVRSYLQRYFEAAHKCEFCKEDQMPLARSCRRHTPHPDHKCNVRECGGVRTQGSIFCASHEKAFQAAPQSDRVVWISGRIHEKCGYEAKCYAPKHFDTQPRAVCYVHLRAGQMADQNGTARDHVGQWEFQNRVLGEFPKREDMLPTPAPSPPCAVTTCGKESFGKAQGLALCETCVGKFKASYAKRRRTAQQWVNAQNNRPSEPVYGETIAESLSQRVWTIPKEALEELCMDLRDPVQLSPSRARALLDFNEAMVGFIAAAQKLPPFSFPKSPTWSADAEERPSPPQIRMELRNPDVPCVMMDTLPAKKLPTGTLIHDTRCSDGIVPILGDGISRGQGNDYVLMPPDTLAPGKYVITEAVPGIHPPFDPMYPKRNTELRATLSGAPLQKPEPEVHMSIPETKPFAVKQGEHAKQALYNVSAKKLGELVAVPAGALIGRGLALDDESIRAKIAEALQSDVGKALLTYLTGLGLETRDLGILPAGVQAKLAEACQVKGMEGGMELALNTVWQPLMETIDQAIRAVAMFVPKTPAALPVIEREGVPDALTTEVPQVIQKGASHE